MYHFVSEHNDPLHIIYPNVFLCCGIPCERYILEHNNYSFQAETKPYYKVFCSMYSTDSNAYTANSTAHLYCLEYRIQYTARSIACNTVHSTA